MPQYDVFLCHNDADHPAVESLARRLVQAGLQPWLDEWNLVPGEAWQPAIERALDECQTCVVFVGPSGISPWQHEEMRAAIEQRIGAARERGLGESAFRVIPVLLPGAERGERSKLPPFLAAATWVEFRSALREGGLDDGKAFHHLLAGIRGVAPGPSPGESVYEGRNPYRGLRTFDVEHAPFFFGREALTGWLLDELRPRPALGGRERSDSRFLAIVGPSGSGKSSLAQAGLLAALKTGAIEGSEKWPRVVFRPGHDPLESLALALSDLPGIAPTPAALDELIRGLLDNERMLHRCNRLSNAPQSLQEASLSPGLWTGSWPTSKARPGACRCSSTRSMRSGSAAQGAP
jgi:hypothetical protein